MTSTPTHEAGTSERLSGERLRQMLDFYHPSNETIGRSAGTDQEMRLLITELLSLRAAPVQGVKEQEAEGLWFDLTGDARLGRCATDNCGGQPTKRLEAGGVGANYCSGCAVSILSALSNPPEGTPVDDKSHPRFMAGYDVGLHDAGLEASSSDQSELEKLRAFQPLNDDQIMEIIKKVAPWKLEAKLYDLLTYEKSVPLFPQATYDVPSMRAKALVRAVEEKIRAAITPEASNDQR